MGRKSRIARGLDIGAAARKMLEKATGTVLTDEEYFTLEHQALKSPIERDLEDFTRVYIRELEGEYWFDEYIKPLPTWSIYFPSYYEVARAILIRSPPREELENEAKYVAGIIEADGSIGFVTRYEYIRAYTSTAMRPKDADVVETIAELWNVKPKWRRIPKEMREARADGLRGYLIVNLMRPHFKGKRRVEGAHFIFEKGYVVTPEDRNLFKTIYKAKRRLTHGEILEEEIYIEPTSEE